MSVRLCVHQQIVKVFTCNGNFFTIWSAEVNLCASSGLFGKSAAGSQHQRSGKGALIMTQRTGTLSSLNDKSLLLRRPLKATVSEVEPNLFVARAPQLRVLFGGSGKTPNVALLRLATGIKCQYRLLAAIPSGSRTVFHRKLLRTFRNFVRESHSRDEPTSTIR